MAHDCPDCGEYCTCDGEDVSHNEAPEKLSLMDNAELLSRFQLACDNLRIASNANGAPNVLAAFIGDKDALQAEISRRLRSDNERGASASVAPPAPARSAESLTPVEKCARGAVAALNLTGAILIGVFPDRRIEMGCCELAPEGIVWILEQALEAARLIGPRLVTHQSPN